MKYLGMMMIVLLSSFPSRGQLVKDSIITKARQYYNDEKYNHAYPLFKEVFADTTGVQSDLYYLGIVSAVKLKDYNQAFTWLKYYIDAVQNPQINFYRLQFNLLDLYKDSRWDTCLAMMQNKGERYDKQMNYNVNLKKQLDELFYDDQKYRILIAPYQKIYGDSSAIMKKLWRNIDLQDSLNLKTLLYLSDKYGWITKKDVGSGAVAQWAVIQHADLATQKRYLPVLKQAAKVGDIRKGSLALTIDRINIREGKRQIYGSQIGRIKWNGQLINIIDPVIDPDNLDKRRKEMGMETIEEYAARFDIDWNLDQYKNRIGEYEKIEGLCR